MLGRRSKREYSQGNILIAETEEVPVDSGIVSTEENAERLSSRHNNQQEEQSSTTTLEVKQRNNDSTATVKRRQQQQKRLSSNNNNDTDTDDDGNTTTSELSSADIRICQRLDREYERALEERDIGYNARYESVRQSAFVSLLFMVVFLIVGTAFFTHQAGWEAHEALFFSIYTMTTVGYGLLDSTIPNHATFQIFVICYIFVGIATLTVVLAQIYQFVALQASVLQHSRDRTGRRKKKKKKQHQQQQKNNTNKQQEPSQRRENMKKMEIEQHVVDEDEAQNPAIISCMEHGAFLDYVFKKYEEMRVFFRTSQTGRSLSVVFPFAGLILLGAIVVGPIEGWGAVDSIYFACVSLTTVGYGNYVPENPISIYFCIFWLPFSIGFMSLFLANIAAFYIRLSDKNINRIERKIRRRIRRLKEQRQRRQRETTPTWCREEAAAKVAAAGSSQSNTNEEEDEDGMKSTSMAARMEYNGANTPSNSAAASSSPDDPEMGVMLKNMSDSDNSGFQLFGTQSTEVGDMRRSQIVENSNYKHKSSGETMQTMKDVLRTVHKNRENGSDFLSIHNTNTNSSPSLLSGSSRNNNKKPTFALRVLVQERFAKIIAADIAGFQSHIEIKNNNTLSVTVNTMKETTDKWSIPKRARKAFRAAAFEVLFFVGEHGLVTRGANALFDDLSPFEFHGLFAPLLAAMGDADVMEQWLETTDVLADVDLSNEHQQQRTKVLASTKTIT